MIFVGGFIALATFVSYQPNTHLDLNKSAIICGEGYNQYKTYSFAELDIWSLEALNDPSDSFQFQSEIIQDCTQQNNLTALPSESSNEIIKDATNLTPSSAFIEHIQYETTGSWFTDAGFIVLFEFILYLVFLLLRMAFFYVLTGEKIWGWN